MPSTDDRIASFGPFRLAATARRLERDGLPVLVGDRALDLLIALVDRAGEIVSHRDLVASAWRGLVVGDGSLRVHISSLRKALATGEGEPCYVKNVAGQGYSFVRPVVFETVAMPVSSSAAQSAPSSKRLTPPQRLARMVGRDHDVRSIAADVLDKRFMTVLGPGGAGKTTVTVAVAHELQEKFADGVCFVDLSEVQDGGLVSSTVATSLGLTLETADVVPTLLDQLRALKILLVLDSCEHVVEAAASLTETIFREAAGVHILATSREALRVEGEHAYWLPTLECPPQNLDADSVLEYPAAQLFMERFRASGGRLGFDAAMARLVAAICNRLDGMALAIELAAGRAGSHGIAATLRLVEQDLELDWNGRRTAHPRHQNLRALLDWSYGLLVDSYQRALEQLSVLVGAFDIDAARAVVEAGLDTLQIIDSLVSKSLVSVELGFDGSTKYRILETTRAYARERLLESGKADATFQRHAEYFANLLDLHHGGHIDLDYAARAPALREHLGNVRAALEWCFSRRDDMEDPTLSVTMAAAAAPMLFELSLLSESLRWSEAGLAALDDATRGDRRELILTTIWAISSMWVRDSSEVLTATARGLELALALDASAHRLRLQALRHMVMTRTADFRGTLVPAADWDVCAKKVGDEDCLSISDLLVAQSRHYLGDQTIACRHFELGFARAGNRNLQMCGMDQRVRALVAWSRALWLSGFPERAVNIARESVASAEGSEKPLNTCFALLFTIPMHLWRRDWSSAQARLDQLAEHTHWRALEPFHATADAMQGAVNIGRGEIEAGIDVLLGLRGRMGDECLNFMGTSIACFLAEGLIAVGRTAEAAATLRSARQANLHGGEAAQLPELFRLEARAQMEESANGEQVVRLLRRSCDLARQQGAMSWNLRSATALARIHMLQGDLALAQSLVEPIYGRFTEGFETHDLKAARQLLRELDVEHRATRL
ncbi:winged helix-turn-helix domain-containing protein [Variovorax sp. OV329]|uniref:ATP-binding protein n=1 Tax=Variovorax sp. OV329 TaxID=1882825 RepID=UPI0008E35849|nr:winged helix-turn-helix domain-containing protein [Variovorax sp. OV329]SFN50355.1 Predicted ATPase [Variovorax sp. OV329]